MRRVAEDLLTAELKVCSAVAMRNPRPRLVLSALSLSGPRRSVRSWSESAMSVSAPRAPRRRQDRADAQFRMRKRRARLRALSLINPRPRDAAVPGVAPH